MSMLHSFQKFIRSAVIQSPHKGGINAAIGVEDSWEAHAYDTAKGGLYPATKTPSKPCAVPRKTFLSWSGWG